MTDERKPDEIEITRILNGIHGIPGEVKLFAPVGEVRANLAIKRGMTFKAWVGPLDKINIEGRMGPFSNSKIALNGPGPFSPVEIIKEIVSELASHTE
jgi:hypothetical protein